MISLISGIPTLTNINVIKLIDLRKKITFWP
jgi:hypothetical protein